jgi:Immunity protein 50
MALDGIGAETLVTWFGEWPSFHDAEIMSVHLDREAMSSLRIRVWKRGDQTDDQGYFVRLKETVVVFEFREIKYLRLEGEDADCQNVISGLSIEKTTDGYRLDLHPCYGLSGQIVAKQLHIRLESGGLT